MGEYAAILIWAGLGAGVALLLALFHVRVPPRRPPPTEVSSPVDLDQALGQFQFHAVLLVSFGFLALLLSAWAAGVGALGRTGLGVAALVTAPLLVGFAHLSGRRALSKRMGDAADADTKATQSVATEEAS